MRVTIPGALADYLAQTDLTAGPAAVDPAAPDARATLDAGTRGRGRTLVITPPSTAVLQFISAFAEAILTNRHLHTDAQARAARTWLNRAGRATSTLATDLAATEAFAASARAVDAVTHAEEIEAAPATIADAEALYAAQLITEAEATDGTWRGAWIGEQPTGELLFTLDPDTEQGALFA
ncbi:hypothetical protein [Streptomyces sp. NPDC006333]|uniref:hypothetical protein n=1 Tax=Streptomyces sp. NPDC006333 TaxID=3156753 RepID=UPI0033B00954